MDINFNTLFAQAREEARRYHHKYIRTEHLLLALVAHYDMSLDMTCIRSSVGLLKCPTCSAEEQMELSASALRAWQLAEGYAGEQTVTVNHVLLGILQSSLTVPKLLETCNIDVPMLVANLESKTKHAE